MQEFNEFDGFGYSDDAPWAADALVPQHSPDPFEELSKMETVAHELGFDTVTDMEAAAKRLGQDIWEDVGCLMYNRMRAA